MRIVYIRCSMGDLLNISEFKKLTDAQQKKFNKSELANIILNAPSVDIILTDLKNSVENLSAKLKDFSKQSATTAGNVAKLVVELRTVQNVNIDLKRRLNELEQHSRINNIEVQGIEASDTI